jgi:hypothetical protein
MLELALQVVEAARSLGLERNGNQTHSVLRGLPLALAIDDLRQAIEDFDRGTGVGLSSPTLQARPDFATPPQLDEPAFAERQEEILDRTDYDVSHGPDAAAEPDELDMPEAAGVQAFQPKLTIPAATAGAAREFIDNCDLGDMEFDDGAETVTDFLEQLDMISDKLQFALARKGWTPKLRALAEAANKARSRMVIDFDEDRTYVRVPASSWAAMNAAVAGAVMSAEHRFAAETPSLRLREPTSGMRRP